MNMLSARPASQASAPKESPYVLDLSADKKYDPLARLPKWLQPRLATEAEVNEHLAPVFCEPARQVLVSSEYPVDRIAQVFARRDMLDDKGAALGITVSDKFADSDALLVVRWVLDGEVTPELLSDPRGFFNAGHVEVVPVSDAIFTIGKGAKAERRIQPHFRGNNIRRIAGKDGARDSYVYHLECNALISESVSEQAARLDVTRDNIPKDEQTRQARVSLNIRNGYGDGYFAYASPVVTDDTKVRPHGTQVHVHELLALLDCQRQAQAHIAASGSKFEASAWATTVVQLTNGYYGVAYEGEEKRGSLGLHAFVTTISEGACMATNVPENALFSGEYLSLR